jgi:hypothetical protein
MNLLRKDSSTSAMSNWHPNFRNAAALPDLKVIRTSFFVNVFCVTLGAAAVLFTAHREFLASNYRSEIEQAERRLGSASARNNQLLGLNREFQAGVDKFAEARDFTNTPLKASDLLVALSRSLPETMEFTTVVFEGGRLTLRGNIQGTPETASTGVQAYSGVLQKDPVLGRHFPEISVAKLDRDSRTQGLAFEMLLKPPAPAPKKKEAKP